MKEVLYLLQDVVLPTCQSGFLILSLFWAFYQLTLNALGVKPPCIHLALQMHVMYMS